VIPIDTNTSMTSRDMRNEFI